MNEIGGFAGRLHQSGINNCYSKCDVTASWNSGGFLGRHMYRSSINNCYTLSNVHEFNDRYHVYVFGPLGNFSYWTPDTSEVKNSSAGTSLTLDQMKTQSSYEGWDFESGTVWKMGEFPELVFSFSIDD